MSSDVRCVSRMYTRFARIPLMFRLRELLVSLNRDHEIQEQGIPRDNQDFECL